MIASLRWPNATWSLEKNPDPSGPRWARTSVIRGTAERISGGRPPSCAKTPQMPHMSPVLGPQKPIIFHQQETADYQGIDGGRVDGANGVTRRAGQGLSGPGQIDFDQPRRSGGCVVVL